MTPTDYDFLRKLLKERVRASSLSADKQYLVESRLLPIARKAGLRRSDGAGAEAAQAAMPRR